MDEIDMEKEKIEVYDAQLEGLNSFILSIIICYLRMCI